MKKLLSETTSSASEPKAEGLGLERQRPEAGRQRKPPQSLDGQRFGRAVVVGQPWPGPNNRTWHVCQCDCGNQFCCPKSNLLVGKTKSCGCLKLDLQTVHGQKHHPSYKRWMCMKYRCENPSSSNYNRYGGRGIKICERWHNVLNFIEDIGSPPSPIHQLDRINNDGDYEPGNVRWVLPVQNMRNRSTAKLLTWNGKTLSLVQWAEMLGFNRGTLSDRIRSGWSVERTLTEKLHEENIHRPRNS